MTDQGTGRTIPHVLALLGSRTEKDIRDGSDGSYFQARGRYHIVVWRDPADGNWGLRIDEFADETIEAPLDFEYRIDTVDEATVLVWLDRFLEGFDGALANFVKAASAARWECGERTPVN